MGCCGHDFESNAKIREAVFKNNLEFKDAEPKTEKEFIAFRDRRPNRDLRNGVCRNLIQEEGCFLCPLHPARHQGKDLRIGHCDTDYLCLSAKNFEKWGEDKKRRFLSFIHDQKLDNVDYSIKMDNDSLLEAFTAAEKNTISSKGKR